MSIPRNTVLMLKIRRKYILKARRNNGETTKFEGEEII